MDYNAETVLDILLASPPRPTSKTPTNARGIYGLVDHLGDLRYIGSTSSASQTLHERVHQRHRTGSEGRSHHLSSMYNVGRMWRSPGDSATTADGKVAKALRNAFIAEHCAAVWVVVPDHLNIMALEREILAIAPAHVIAWNGGAMPAHEEPVELVNRTLANLGWGATQIAALERQRQRHDLARTPPQRPTIPATTGKFPTEGFHFFALDVETANGDRASICQIGVACVRDDGSITTWATYVDPRTDRWSFTGLHGISRKTVAGARPSPKFFPSSTKSSMAAPCTSTRHSTGVRLSPPAPAMTSNHRRGTGKTAC